MCVINFSTSTGGLTSNPSSFLRKLQRKTNDSLKWYTLRLPFPHFFATLVFIIRLPRSYRVWSPGASGEEDQKLAVSTVFLTTSISILHRWSLPGLKGLMVLHYHLGWHSRLVCFASKNLLFIQPVGNPRSYTQPVLMLRSLRELLL